MIFFDEPSHTYRLDDPINGELCISVTTLLEIFKNKFDSDFWSYYHGLRKALEREKDGWAKYLSMKYGYRLDVEIDKKSYDEQRYTLQLIGRSHGISPEEIEFGQKQILQEWKIDNNQSKEKGTKFHNHKEGEAYKNSGIKYEGEHIILGSQVNDLSNLCNPLHPVYIPELRIYNREFRVSGTADKNYFFPNRDVDIDDWKTNKKIDRKGFRDQKMKYVLRHLDDCNYNHYCLQVSTYAWMLEQWGYKPKNLKFTHVKLADDGLTILESTEYHTNYMKYEVELMLNYFNDNREYLLSTLKK